MRGELLIAVILSAEAEEEEGESEKEEEDIFALEGRDRAPTPQLAG